MLAAAAKRGLYIRMTLEILPRPLSYVAQLESRNTACINLVVIHCTELPDLDTARTWGEKVIHPDSRTGNSGHFYIDRDGSIEEWVPAIHVAHHVRGYNQKSIGIELINNGRYPGWFNSRHQQMTEPYPLAQIQALVVLLRALTVKLSGLVQVTGHDALDTALIPADDNPNIMIRRKLDPGPCFPWQAVLSEVSLDYFTTHKQVEN